MFIDFDIPIPEDNGRFPVYLRDDLEALEKSYAEDKPFDFARVLDSFESSVKSAYHDGRITRDEVTLLFDRYGI